MKIFGNKLLDLIKTITQREYVGKFILKKLKPTGYQIQIGHHFLTTDSNDQNFVYQLFKEEFRNVFQYSNYFETNLQYPPYDQKCLHRNLILEEEPTIFKILYNQNPITSTIKVVEGSSLELHVEVNEPFKIISPFEYTYTNNILYIDIPVLNSTNLHTKIQIVTDSNKIYEIPIIVLSKYIQLITSKEKQFVTSDGLNFIVLRNGEL